MRLDYLSIFFHVILSFHLILHLQDDRHDIPETPRTKRGHQFVIAFFEPGLSHTITQNNGFMHANLVNKGDDLSVLKFPVITIPNIADNPNQRHVIVLHILFEKLIVKRPVRLQGIQAIILEIQTITVSLQNLDDRLLGLPQILILKKHSNVIFYLARDVEALVPPAVDQWVNVSL